MNGVLTTVPAHFDGVQIKLDVEVELKPDTRLLVTILGGEPSDEALVWSAMRASEAAFARVWDNEKVEQSPARMERKRQLAAAAEALLPDYAAGGELTVFTVLDGEDFYA